MPPKKTKATNSATKIVLVWYQGTHGGNRTSDRLAEETGGAVEQAGLIEVKTDLAEARIDLNQRVSDSISDSPTKASSNSLRRTR